MKAFKRILCIALALLMTVGMTVTGAAVIVHNGIISGTFQLSAFENGEPNKQIYYYSDKYFLYSGKKTDEHMRTMSGVMAFSADGDSSQTNTLFKEIGFDRIQEDDMAVTTSDSIGSVIAQKNVGGVPVIAAVIRGSGYQNEWASNVRAGLDGDMSGFAAAAQKVTDRLKAYMINSGMKKAKYWITGYSRGGAVANLVGKALNENLDLFQTTDDDVYVYTFEAPKCSEKPVAYENIHNIVDSSDVVTQFYPGVWPAGRNGVDEEIGDPDEMIMSKTLVLSEPYFKDFRETNLTEFIKEIADLVGDKIDRKTYAQTAEDSISALMDMYFSLSAEEQSSLMTFMKQVWENIKIDPNFPQTIVRVKYYKLNEKTINIVVDFLMNNINTTVETNGQPLSDEDFKVMTDAVDPLVRVLLPIIKADMSNEFVSDNGSIDYITLYHVATFAGNISEIIAHHYDRAVFEKLKALDSFYVKRSAKILGDVDGDGFADVIDATLIQKYLVDIYLMDDTAIRLSDVDKDKEVNIIDATCIQRFDAQMKAPEGIGLPI